MLLPKRNWYLYEGEWTMMYNLIERYKQSSFEIEYQDLPKE